MAFKLCEINSRARSDPKGFIDECDAAFESKISAAANQIAENIKNSPIVLLSGPSASGKTTTSKKIEEVLGSRGIQTHAVGMDDYFRSHNTYIAPRNSDGSPNLESPDCVDMELLCEHFSKLEKGMEVMLPKFDFAKQLRVDALAVPLKLQKDEIAVFEGIHALNDHITSQIPGAFKLYISACSRVEDEGKTVFEGEWMRLLRRTVRDHLFRGADALTTLKMWSSVRRGEKRYISPFKNQANLKFDSAFPYEVCVLGNIAAKLFDEIPPDAGDFPELRLIRPACDMFAEISPKLLNPESLLTEFTGGGSYKY